MSRAADVCKQTIHDHVGEPFTLSGFLGEGRDSIVYKGKYKNGPPIDVAVKFYVPKESGSLFSEPSRLPAFANELSIRFASELDRLRSIDHPNLQKYIAHGVFPYTKNYFHAYNVTITPDQGIDVPFIVSRYVSGTPLDQHLKQETLDRAEIVRVLRGASRALQCLHQEDLKISHGDIRLENVIVESATKAAVLIDFGLSKSFSMPRTEWTRLFANPGLLPSCVSQALDNMKREEGWNRGELCDALFPWQDLYAFGLLLQELLQSASVSKLDDLTKDFIRHVAEECGKWTMNPEDNHPTNLTRMEGSITSAFLLVDRLDRLKHGNQYYDRTFGDREPETPRTIVRSQDSLIIRSSLAPLLARPGLRRLHNLNQLSLVHYIYPSARQSRFDHILATLGITQKVWRSLSNNATFLFHMGIEDLNRLELMALFHDVNHFPFLHYFQEAGIPVVERANVLDTLLARDNTLTQILEKHGVTLQYLRTMLSGENLVDASPADQIIKSVINSGVDVDKLAYLQDDSFYTGVRFGGGIDLHGLLGHLEVDLVPIGEGGLEQVWHVLFSHEALPAVESVCLARYWNFQRIYWHHVNRAIASMIIWTVRRLYTESDDSPVTYLQETHNLGEAGAIEFLSERYRKRFDKPAPVDKLGIDRERTFKRVFEMMFSSQESLLRARNEIT